MFELMQRLYPICRSITGEGVRETLAILAERLPLDVVSVPSGTKVHDWVVNDEWNVRDAWIADATGRRVVDFREHNLHLVGYSVPVRTRMTLAQLREHLFTLPDHPDWIPYRTSYYNRSWGFCLTQRQLDELDEGPYDVVVDSSLEPGELTYGELFIPGRTSQEILVSAHVCHPSLANDNLAGIAVAVELAEHIIATGQHRYGFRFLFAPGTIGSLTWLSRNQDVLARIRHGLVLTGLGGPGPLVYKRTRRGGTMIDRVAEQVVGRTDGQIRDYSPYGYDERQFNALGFDLAVGRLSRTPHGEYPQYHTSADNLELISEQALAEAYGAVVQIMDILDTDRAHRNLSPYGEPQLGTRGLYPTVGGQSATEQVMAMLWLLSYSDGAESLLDIAQRSGLEFAVLDRAARDLVESGLLEVVEPVSRPERR
jgi:aminopeptidase-like protein